MQILAVTNVTLAIESAAGHEGPWIESTTFAAATDTMIVLSSEGGSINFSRYIRWRFEGDGVNAWNICSDDEVLHVAGERDRQV